MTAFVFEADAKILTELANSIAKDRLLLKLTSGFIYIFIIKHICSLKVGPTLKT